MRVLEYLAAFYGFVTAYSVLYLAGQWIGDWLEQRTAPEQHRGQRA